MDLHLSRGPMEIRKCTNCGGIVYLCSVFNYGKELNYGECEECKSQFKMNEFVGLELL